MFWLIFQSKYQKYFIWQLSHWLYWSYWKTIYVW